MGTGHGEILSGLKGEKEILTALTAVAFLVAAIRRAGPRRFFKAGDSLAPDQNGSEAARFQNRVADLIERSYGREADDSPEATATPMVLATPTATIQQVPVRVASLPAQTKRTKRDIPYAIPVPNKPGFVTSPYAPKEGLVDVRGFSSGTEVIDPYSGKIFLTP